MATRTASPKATRPPRGAVVDPRRRRWVIALGVVLTVAVTLWAVLLSPATRIRHVRVDGVTGPVETQARHVVDQERGRSLLLTRTGPLETAVEADRRIANAAIHRDFPDALVVTITPRVPVLAAANAKGQLDLVDIEGVRFAAVVSPPAGVAVVRGQGSTGVADGALRVALDVLKAMPAGLRGQMTDIRVDSADSVSFRLGATAIAWGNATQAEVKARLVAVLLQQKPATIDVSAPDTPVTT